MLNRPTVRPREEPSSRSFTALRAPCEHEGLHRLDEREVTVRLLGLQLVGMSFDHGLSYLDLGLEDVLPAHTGRLRRPHPEHRAQGEEELRIRALGRLQDRDRLLHGVGDLRPGSARLWTLDLVPRVTVDQSEVDRVAEDTRGERSHMSERVPVELRVQFAQEVVAVRGPIFRKRQGSARLLAAQPRRAACGSDVVSSIGEGLECSHIKSTLIRPYRTKQPGNLAKGYPIKIFRLLDLSSR